MTDIVYLNGEFIAKSSAKISVLDRGFLFGDGIYEVIPVYNGKAFRLQQHLERLIYCLEQVDIQSPYTLQKWHELIVQIIAKSVQPHISIYIQVSRGCQIDRVHTVDNALTPSVLIMPSELSPQVAELAPIKATLKDDIRWQYCHIKSTSLLANIILRQEAHKQGFQEALLHRNGVLTEGATSNIFVVCNNNILTPKNNQSILGGITRDLIIELAQNASINLVETDINISTLDTADEVWISSSSREISPVTQIDDKIVASGEIGPVTQKMHRAFQVFKQTLIND